MALSKKDKEDIATALLLGCEFFYVPEGPHKGWYVHSDGIALHPMELARKKQQGGWLQQGWRSKGVLARDYIKFTLESNNG